MTMFKICALISAYACLPCTALMGPQLSNTIEYRTYATLTRVSNISYFLSMSE